MMHGSAHADSAGNSPGTPRRGAGATVILGLAVLMMALAPATAAQAKVPKNFVGITEGGAVSEADYQKMRDIGVRSKRISINWKATEPRRDTFRWARTDNQVAALARNKISPVLIIWGAPKWATKSNNAAVPPLKGTPLKHWKRFLKTVVKRYKKGGEFWDTHPTLPSKPARTWQIWNEPNLAKYFAKKGSPSRQPKRAPKAYGKFVKASSKTINRADKRAKIVLAGLSGDEKRNKRPEKFITKLLTVKKVTKRFDAVALHPYAKNMKQYKNRISKFRKALKKHGAKKKEIWLTEVGWGSAKNSKRLNKGLAGQARMLQKSFKKTVKMRKPWNIERIYWFEWRDPPKSAPVGCSFCPSAGLLRNDRTAKPSFRKFKRFVR
jgi:hypothetical protein